VITPEDVPRLLLDACPSFASKWTEVEVDNADRATRLHYLDAGELIRHMVHLRQQHQVEEFDPIFRVIEQLVTEGDEYVNDLGVIGYLEGLQMETVTGAGIDPEAEFRPRLGPVSARWWDRINRF